MMNRTLVFVAMYPEISKVWVAPLGSVLKVCKSVHVDPPFPETWTLMASPVPILFPSKVKVSVAPVYAEVFA